MQTELKYTARFPKSLNEPLIWDSEERLSKFSASTSLTETNVPYAVVVRVLKNIHIFKMHVDYNKVYACYAIKIFKNKPLKNIKQGGTSLVRQR